MTLNAVRCEEWLGHSRSASYGLAATGCVASTPDARVEHTQSGSLIRRTSNSRKKQDRMQQPTFCKTNSALLSVRSMGLTKWSGYHMTTIHHPHFGNEPVKVLAIDVSKLQNKENL